MNIITILDDLIHALGNLSFNYKPSEDFKSLDESILGIKNPIFRIVAILLSILAVIGLVVLVIYLFIQHLNSF